jgi:catechol 2,3-dioxygenase
MTAIKGLIPPTRRQGLLGVHSLDHFCVTVPELAKAEDFYRAFGLDVRERDGALHLHTDGSSHCWGVVREGAAKRLHHITYGAFADEIPDFCARLQRLRIARIDPPRGIESDGLWFRDPGGSLLEIKAADKSSPDAKAVVHNLSGPAGVRAAPVRGEAAKVRPRRLAHVLLFSPDIRLSIAFYQDVLGLRLSDEAGVVAFLHGIHGSDHHLIAFAKSEAPGFHHASWDTGSIHEVGLGAQQMADRGYQAGWGLGRHVLGSNYFHYVRDPWGSYSEYSSDIDYIPADSDWQAGHFTPENGFYLWGPEPPKDFAKNFET